MVDIYIEAVIYANLIGSTENVAGCDPVVIYIQNLHKWPLWCPNHTSLVKSLKQQTFLKPINIREFLCKEKRSSIHFITAEPGFRVKNASQLFIMNVNLFFSVLWVG